MTLRSTRPKTMSVRSYNHQVQCVSVPLCKHMLNVFLKKQVRRDPRSRIAPIQDPQTNTMPGWIVTFPMVVVGGGGPCWNLGSPQKH